MATTRVPITLISATVQTPRDAKMAHLPCTWMVAESVGRAVMRHAEKGRLFVRSQKSEYAVYSGRNDVEVRVEINAPSASRELEMRKYEMLVPELCGILVGHWSHAR